jgi:formate dehydrogenase assembly factor FdhD
MLFCPTCRKQFKNASNCPDCKTALVKELPYQTVQSDGGTTWVEIVSTSNSDEAQLIRGFLEAEGIPAQIEHAEASVLPTNIGTLGDERIYVRAEDEEAAIDLLQKREAVYKQIRDDDDTLVTDDGVAELDENAVPEPE